MLLSFMIHAFYGVTRVFKKDLKKQENDEK